LLAEENSSKEFEFLTKFDNDVAGHQYYSLEPILRMTLSLTILHFINIMIILPNSNFSEVWHDGFWFLKFIISIGLWVLLFSISNNTLRIWLRVAVLGALTFCFFIVTGIILGILKLNQVVFMSSVKTRNCTHYLVYFINFSTDTDKEEKCGMNAILIITTFAILGMTQGVKFRGDESSFTKALLNFWFTYLLWNALAD
jgi:hypothetical protein